MTEEYYNIAQKQIVSMGVLILGGAVLFVGGVHPGAIFAQEGFTVPAPGQAYVQESGHALRLAEGESSSLSISAQAGPEKRGTPTLEGVALSAAYEFGRATGSVQVGHLWERGAAEVNDGMSWGLGVTMELGQNADLSLQVQSNRLLGRDSGNLVKDQEIGLSASFRF